VARPAMPALHLVPMTVEEYDAWVDGEIRSYSEEHVRAGDWLPEGALDRARKEFAALLPGGVATPGHYLYTLQVPDPPTRVGLVWFQAGASGRPGEPPRAFVYDLLVQPERRGQGYGEAAMRLVEVEVLRLGFSSVSLHVFGHNTVARGLYEKLGYVATNVLMKKSLPGA
jgi:ribosomal protein S18 acetylase RimI-like enzyme